MYGLPDSIVLNDNIFEQSTCTQSYWTTTYGFLKIYMASAIYVYPLQKVISHNIFLKLYSFIFFV